MGMSGENEAQGIPIPFLGQKTVNLDDKGRLAIPSSLRDLLPGGDVKRVLVINGLDGCVFVYPANQMNQLMKRLETGRFLSQKKARQFQRQLFYGSSVETLDGQGRIPLSQLQTDHAGLERKAPVTVVGNIDHIELWNPERYVAHVTAEDEDGRTLDEMAEAFFAPDTEA